MQWDWIEVIEIAGLLAEQGIVDGIPCLLDVLVVAIVYTSLARYFVPSRKGGNKAVKKNGKMLLDEEDAQSRMQRRGKRGKSEFQNKPSSRPWFFTNCCKDVRPPLAQCSQYSPKVRITW
jgi:hypothetical protein